LKNNQFLVDSGAKYPLICGAMYPCSNPELVSAVSKMGALGIVQPISLVYAHKRDFRTGLQEIIKNADSKPVGLNLLVEKTAKRYEDRLKEWLDISMECGVRFFVTALGNPSWVVKRAEQVGGVVYHDVTEAKWAQKALDAGVKGLICVNNRAGGHLGVLDPLTMIEECEKFKVPLVCAGGVGHPQEFKEMLKMGYSAVQMGTRFIASKECSAHEDYKKAILAAKASDIVSTTRISGVPVSVIQSEFLKSSGTEPGHVVNWLLSHPNFKHYARLVLNVKSIISLKKSNQKGLGYKDYWQAGKSVEKIDEIMSVEEIIKSFVS
jgi:nitronate monooxygenase